MWHHWGPECHADIWSSQIKRQTTFAPTVKHQCRRVKAYLQQETFFTSASKSRLRECMWCHCSPALLNIPLLWVTKVQHLWNVLSRSNMCLSLLTFWDISVEIILQHYSKVYGTNNKPHMSFWMPSSHKVGVCHFLATVGELEQALNTLIIVLWWWIWSQAFAWFNMVQHSFVFMNVWTIFTPLSLFLSPPLTRRFLTLTSGWVVSVWVIRFSEGGSVEL